MKAGTIWLLICVVGGGIAGFAADPLTTPWMIVELICIALGALAILTIMGDARRLQASFKTEQLTNWAQSALEMVKLLSKTVHGHFFNEWTKSSNSPESFDDDVAYLRRMQPTIEAAHRTILALEAGQSSAEARALLSQIPSEDSMRYEVTMLRQLGDAMGQYEARVDELAGNKRATEQSSWEMIVVLYSPVLVPIAIGLAVFTAIGQNRIP